MNVSFFNDEISVFLILKGAFIGSNKGICRAYDTEGYLSLISF